MREETSRQHTAFLFDLDGTLVDSVTRASTTVDTPGCRHTLTTKVVTLTMGIPF